MWFSGLCIWEFSSISGCGCFVLVQHFSAGTLFLLPHSPSPPRSPLSLPFSLPPPKFRGRFQFLACESAPMLNITGDIRLMKLISIPQKMMECVFLETISKHRRTRRLLREGWFCKGELMFSTLITFYSKMPRMLYVRRAEDFIIFRKIFTSVSHNLLIEEVIRYKVDNA